MAPFNHKARPLSCCARGCLRGGSLPPEILEPVRRQRRIDRCARNRAMAEPSLDRPGIVPLVGKRIAAGVAKHVRVSLQFKAETTACRPLDHPGKACSRERRAALADKDKRRRRALTL